jgi:outer membrane lipoprotein carrier protein
MVIGKSFRGQFVQKVFDQDGNAIQEVKGHMLFKKPNFFKWVYSEPFKNQIISDGEFLYLYDPDLKQVIITKLSRLGNSSPAMLLVSENVKNLFDTEKFYDEKNLVWFKSLPKNPNTSSFKEVLIRYDENKLKRMKILDNFDHITDISFLNIIQNESINDAVFLFNLPEGVDVIKN